MTMFLLSLVNSRPIAQDGVFAIVKSIIFGNEKERFEIDDFGILSLAGLQISPPWHCSRVVSLARANSADRNA